MITIDKIGHYNIYSNNKGAYIIHNTKKSFEYGHSHINNYNTARYLATLALKKKVPERLGRYQLISLLRISDSRTYKIKLRNHFFEILEDVEID